MKIFLTREQSRRMFQVKGYDDDCSEVLLEPTPEFSTWLDENLGKDGSDYVFWDYLNVCPMWIVFRYDEQAVMFKMGWL